TPAQIQPKLAFPGLRDHDGRPASLPVSEFRFAADQGAYSTLEHAPATLGVTPAPINDIDAARREVARGFRVQAVIAAATVPALEVAPVRIGAFDLTLGGKTGSHADGAG